MGDFIVTINDLRKAGYCVAGARRWAIVQGFDFRDFLTNGISAARLTATNDALAQTVLSKIKERADGGVG